MRLSVVLGAFALFLLPAQSQSAWDIFQSYVILDSGSGDQYLAGGLNADGASAFAGTDLGDFTAADALTLNGGELKTYKNGGSNVCGGTLNYRVYASGDTPGAFTVLGLPFSANLNGSDQKWATTGQAIDLLDALTAGDYVLELYWEADGNNSNPSGCGETQYDNDSGNNFTATFSILSAGACGTSVNFDGYDYETVQIGDQCWFAENLRTTVYADGTAIPEVTDQGTWNWLSSGARCDYNHNASNAAFYGRLYNWYAADDPRGLCPSGWHVPSDEEWTNLENYITSQNFNGTEGTALKATSGWIAGGNGTDDFGFSALPGGRRWTGLGFIDAGEAGNWWSTTISGVPPTMPDTYLIKMRALNTNSILYEADLVARIGMSVRCLGDADQTEPQGCTDPGYIEYDASATTDDGSCATLVVEGCTDSGYTEYDPSANVDDGSCATLVVEGCTDSDYTEYDPSANVDDGSCATLVVEGCTDADYTEYDASANTDDGSCATLVVEGCTDANYTEYDASANTDDGSCATLLGCTDSDMASMDGYNYGLTTIGDQCWFAENLRTTLYADGSAIPELTDHAEWAAASTGARCDYDNVPLNVATYGRLYNWHAATDASGLCPSGWHVPTDGEWTGLEDYITSQGFDGTEGTALKSTSGWSAGNGTDDFGFTALPGGRRNNGNFDSFTGIGTIGRWWSSSPDGSDAWSRNMNQNPGISRGSTDPGKGFSIRCLRNADHTESQGCTDPAYLEFDASANVDDNSCTTPVVFGCTDDTACNYNATATNDDGSCESLSCTHCTDPDYLTIVTQNASSSLDPDGTATLSASEGTADWTIQRDGETVHTATSASQVALSGLAPGAYLIQIQSGSGCETQATFSIGAAPISFHERQFFEHDSNSNLGRYVHIEDTIAVAGAEDVDEVHVYHLNADGNWHQAQVLNGPAGSDFGEIVLVADGRLFIGADDYSGTVANSGAVLVFEHDGDSWNAVQTIENPAPIMWAEYDKFGNNVAYANEVLYVGAPDGETETTSGIIQTGAVYAFGLNQGQWELLDTLVPDGLDEYSFFGQGLAASGNFICAGGPYYDEEAGCAASWSFDGSTFTQLGGLITASDATAYDGFGWELDVDGNTLVIGAPWRNADAGAAYIFEYAGNEGWVEMELLTPNDLGDDDNFGDGIELDNNLLLIGAWDQDIATDESAEGVLYSSFIHNETGWEPFELLIACGIAEESEFGRGVSQSGGHLIIGANERNAEDGSVSDIGGVYFFSLEEPTASLINSTAVATCAGEAEGSISAEVDGLGEVTFHWTGPDNESGTPYQSNTEDAQSDVLYGLYPGDYQLQMIYASGCELTANITVPTTPQGQNGCPIITPGCTDPNYLEFDSSANEDDGSCATLIVEGCTNPAYTEYNAAANTDDGSCSTLVVEGCTDSNYTEYDASANTDDGSCSTLVVEGCTNANYVEYDASANTDDGSCATLVVEGCTDSNYIEYDASANTDDGSCETQIVQGCTDPEYTEYNPAANSDDGSCQTPSDPCIIAIAPSFALDFGQPDMVLSTGDDDYSNVALPFPFDFSGTSYESVTIASNGVLGLGSSSTSDPYPQALADYQTDVILGAHHDLNPSASASSLISYGIHGMAPNRAFVASWRGIPSYDDNSLLHDFQIVLYEAGNVIEIWNGGHPYIAFGYITIGIAREDGTGIGPSNYNDEALAAGKWSFTPDGSGGHIQAQSSNSALSLESIVTETPATTIDGTDGQATLLVNAGDPTSLTLTGINGAGDYSFAQPGSLDGIAPGLYSVTATDANGCTSNALTLIMTYALCCDCGVSDADSDGLCDDEDNCTDKTATNYADPANGACTY
ncbi:MAG: FISUMP domain-containing protein [Bacteroidota bacterium]|nr:FISUMP domain-containing protein [Bacteroidota bacterium]